MAQQDILLPGIEHQSQGVEYLCGPACINIVLSFWDKNQPMDFLWSEVQGNSGTQSRPSDAPEDDGSFPNQVCEKCAEGTYDCWYTSPEAMAATINDFSPTSVQAEYLSSQLVIERIADSLSASAPVPAPFTTQPALHWVVAVGYQLDGSGSAIIWNGNKITGLYVRDPNQPDPGSDITQLVTIAGLFDPITTSLLMSVECGPNKDLYPVVAKGVPDWGTNDITSITTMWKAFLRFVYRPVRYFMPVRDPRRPGPPPPRRTGDR